VRHALGAFLLEQGRVGEAEAVFRKDLEQHPGNVWALHGLAECLQKVCCGEGAGGSLVHRHLLSEGA
jgi:hypothetical protein